MEIRCLKIRIRIHIEQDGDKYYAYCPELKGVHEAGDSVDDAINNAREAAMVYIGSIIEHNDPLPLCAEEVELSLSALFEKAKSYFDVKKKPIVRVEDLDISFA